MQGPRRRRKFFFRQLWRTRLSHVGPDLSYDGPEYAFRTRLAMLDPNIDFRLTVVLNPVPAITDPNICYRLLLYIVIDYYRLAISDPNVV